MRKVWFVMGLLLAAVLVLAVAVPASAAVEFTDIEDSAYEASILNLASREIVGGYDDGTFRPDNPLQRQQFAKMAVLTMGYEVTAADVSTFPDTPAPYDPVNNPLYPGSYAAVATANEIILGYTNGNFGFTDNVTRQQVISVAVRAAGDMLEEAPADYMGELDYSNQYHGANIKKAEYNGLLAGIVDLGDWDLTANATRGETAEILSQLFYRTGKILTVSGPTGTVELSMTELMAMDATEGYGGWRNKLGNITGPFMFKGVAIQDLMELVGGGTTATAIATDGYESDYTADDLNGMVTVYDPATGEEIADYAGDITMILAYESDGAALPSENGALRIALVSEAADQVTSSGMWAKQVAKIEAQWILTVTGPTETVELSLTELMAMDATEGYGGWRNKSGTITGPFLFKGVAIQDLMALVGGGTTATVIATDGWESEFTADDLSGMVTVYDPVTGEEIADYAGTITVILAYESDGAALPLDNGALRVALVSEADDQVTSSGMWAKKVAALEVQ